MNPDKKTTSGCPWRPKSSRVGISPPKYVAWNLMYFFLEMLNRKLSFNPNRKISWDKWPLCFGILYIMSKMRFNRSNAMTDPYDYKTNDNQNVGAEPESVKHGFTANGLWASDNDNPQMGMSDTRFSSNIPPIKVRADVENITPSARDVGKHRWRKLDPVTGKEIVIPAMILNDLAGSWIHFEFHSFGGDTLRDPISRCPYQVARSKEDNWPGDVGLISRTTQDPTRLEDNGRPTVINKKTVAWIQGQIYGNSEEIASELRTYKAGEMILDKDGRLPEDPTKPGIDKTGFNHDFHPMLSLLHWLFVSEHNAIAAHYAAFHPDWDDEKLYQMARKVNIALAAKIHTIEWTKDLLQHPTLQKGMDCDWYGPFGKKTKLFLMRFFDRHPTISKLTTFLRNSDTLWGMPGSKWEHHDAPFQLPKQFRLVYRLHELVLGEHEICDPVTNRTLDRIQLLDFIHTNTRSIVAKFGYETLAWSFVKKSCGALTLHNFPRALTKFENQQEKVLTGLAERDIFRERAEGSGTYNDFRQSMGEPPVKSFLELTGGDIEIAKELETLYEGDIDKVDPGIGILVEPKPAGFALGITQFYQFLLNAPRRVKSNRHMTENFSYKEYLEGMDWLEHSNGMLGVMSRHLPGLKPLMEGVTRPFAPWKDVENFPFRLLTKLIADESKVLKSDLMSCFLAGLILWMFSSLHIFSTLHCVLLLGAVVGWNLALLVRRTLAVRFLDQCWKKCYTDKRSFFFGTLARAEKQIKQTAFFSKFLNVVPVLAVIFLAKDFINTHLALDALLAALVINGLILWRRANAFIADAHLLKISLRNRMREGGSFTSPETLSGKTALEKTFSALRSGNEKNVATLSSIYTSLRESGISRRKALRSAIRLVRKFGWKTRKGQTKQEKRESGIGLMNFFSIYIPNLGSAIDAVDDPIYAQVWNKKGLNRGDIDLDEFDLMFRKFAPGRDYMTQYDFSRMREAVRLDCNPRKLGSWLCSLLNGGRSKLSTNTFMIFADRIAKEELDLVPAISKEQLLRIYQGTALCDLRKELIEGDLDPSPVTNLRVLRSLNKRELNQLYRQSKVSEPHELEGCENARIISSSSIGKLFCWISVNRLYGSSSTIAKSWFDGKKTIVNDAKISSLTTLFIHHEFRKIQDGLFLGKAYLKLPFGMHLALFLTGLEMKKEIE